MHLELRTQPPLLSAHSSMSLHTWSPNETPRQNDALLWLKIDRQCSENWLIYLTIKFGKLLTNSFKSSAASKSSWTWFTPKSRSSVNAPHSRIAWRGQIALCEQLWTIVEWEDCRQWLNWISIELNSSLTSSISTQDVPFPLNPEGQGPHR